MPEIPDGISRQAIEASDWDKAYWLPRYHELTRGPFLTAGHKDNFRSRTPNTEVDHAMSYLYDDLGNASDGKLKIPEELGVDQIEDWFISRAIAKGIQLQADITEMNARFREHGSN